MQKWVFTIPLPVLCPERRKREKKGEMYRGKIYNFNGGRREKRARGGCVRSEIFGRKEMG